MKNTILAWKNRIQTEGIQGVSQYNAEILLRYIFDMESGLNIALGTKKGGRSYIRLNILRTRMRSMFRIFEKIFNLSKVTDIKEEQIHSYFSDIRNGKIKKKNGLKYKSVRDQVKDFKAFWHWWQKVNKKQGIGIEDITVDLDQSSEKPKWVYLTDEEVRYLAENVSYKYKVLIWFLYDTGIRAPTELSNVRVSDFYNDFKELNIRQEISKTFGRKIKLMLSSDFIRQYIKAKKLSKEDYVFDICPKVVNHYLKRAGLKLFGDKETPAGQKYSELTMYDFRHCSCCYWLPKYKSESALKYRFGWKESDKIHYYSELLGMSDTISEEDMLADTTKTELEKRLGKSETEKEIMQERMRAMEIQMAKILERADKIESEADNG